MDIPQIVAGRFRIECEIGRGGMGTVYRASQLGLERPVAVKVLKKEFAEDPEVAERFLREARTMARLRHEHAAIIFDAGRLTDGRPFIVMEYAEGRTLADALRAEGPFAPARAVRIASEICDVLAEAHALGIVHRDLKPSNIMLTERGACVLDFGIAKLLAGANDATRTHGTTESGVVIGTPRYMSPEQCLGQRVGPASDLYSVGVLVYEMLAGEPPFVDPLASAVLVKQATKNPQPILARRPDAPRELAIAVHTLLAKNPASRPRTARDARRMLERSVAQKAHAENDTEPFASTIVALNTGRSRFLRAVAVCVAVATVGAAALSWANSAAQRATDAPSLKSARASVAPPAVEKTNAASLKTSVSTSTSTKPSATTASEPKETRAEDSRASVLTREDARRLASQVSRRGFISDALIFETREGQAVSAIQEEAKRGGASLFVMQRRGEGFRVTGRAALDAPDFRAARWTQDAEDADGDGADEIICTGARAENRNGARRYVLYSPRTRETYALTVAPEAGRKLAKARWSQNAKKASARPFRNALLKRASSSRML